MKQITYLYALLAATGALADGPAYLDRSIPATNRIAMIQKRVHAELANPTPPRRGAGGGKLDHEYVLAQNIRAFQRIVNYYNRDKKKWMDDPVALAALRAAMTTEENPRTKEVMQIALAGLGDASFESLLVEVLQRDGEPTFKRFALEAVGETNPSSAIPHLVPLLKDPYETPRGCVRPTPDTPNTRFPIRDGAAAALRQLGVTVTKTGHGQYTVDQESLKKAQENAEPEN